MTELQHPADPKVLGQFVSSPVTVILHKPSGTDPVKAFPERLKVLNEVIVSISDGNDPEMALFSNNIDSTI